ncbi:hypothetical protein NX059_002336 [Plenodomus lindquistii]|nr:hypothetical protein NX059_002336 [Plenodomus lindquistii]
MSDNDSVGSSPRRDSNHRRLPQDFPIRTGTFTADITAFNNQISGLIAEFRELHQRVLHRDAIEPETHLNEPYNFPLGLGAFGTPDHSVPEDYSIPADDSAATQSWQRAFGLAPPVDMEKSAPKKVTKRPVTTLVNALPPTTYSEGDIDSTKRTHEYITVQRAILQFLGKRASDTLSARQASAWTGAIEPKTKMPSAKDALHLCYYMRSQGFDTFAEIHDRILSLCVADQDSKDDEASRDNAQLYWKQDFSTNHIIFSVSSETRNPTGRRNAVVGRPPPVGNALVLDLMTGMRGSDSWGGPALEIVDGFGGDDQVDNEDMDATAEANVLGSAMAIARQDLARQAPPAQQSPRQSQSQVREQARTQLTARMAEAQGDLDNILSSETMDPGYISIQCLL